MKIKQTIMALILSGSLAGCSVLAGQTPGTLPTATQLLGACQAGEAATTPPTPSSKVPDCVAYYSIQQLCNIASLGQAVAPFAGTAGSLVETGAVITIEVCTADGFTSVAATK